MGKKKHLGERGQQRNKKNKEVRKESIAQKLSEAIHQYPAQCLAIRKGNAY